MTAGWQGRQQAWPSTGPAIGSAVASNPMRQKIEDTATTAANR